MNNHGGLAGADIIARQIARYGDIYSTELKLDADYTEAQCGACPHEHRCCDLGVTISPYEALGIMSWLKIHKPDWTAILDRVKMRAEAMVAFFRDSKLTSIQECLGAWYERRIKCVFYDVRNKQCSIYPVRPMVCRKAFGVGDCNVDGVKTIREHEGLLIVRRLRVRIAQLQERGISMAEMCSMITLLRQPGTVTMVDEQDRAFFRTEPLLLSDEQILWGFGARPVDNPVSEEANGRP